MNNLDYKKVTIMWFTKNKATAYCMLACCNVLGKQQQDKCEAALKFDYSHDYQMITIIECNFSCN